MDSRQHERFSDNIGAVAILTLEDADRTFQPVLHGLVVDESLGGCNLVVVSLEPIRRDCPCVVQVETLAPFRGLVAWYLGLATHVYRVGIRYTD